MKSIFFALAVLISIRTKAQLFTQNFESSTVLSDYFNASPGANQFNSIKVNGTNTASIYAGSLRFTRGDDNSGFYRNTDFQPSPIIIQYKFDIEISDNTAAQTTAAIFMMGSDFGTGVSSGAEPNGDIHSKLGVNFGSVSGQFALKDISGGQASSIYSGRQTVTWVVNNSEIAINYTGPDGSIETVAADTWDLWIGANKELNDRNAVTGTQELKNFKFIFYQGTGTIDIDNITITDFTALPVNLTAFDAELKNGAALLHWATASEENNSHFNIYRSIDGLDFEKITSVTGKGNSVSPHLYSYRDNGLKPGTNYYRLEQEDYNGEKSILGIISLKNEMPIQLEQINVDQQEAEFSIYSPHEQPAVLTIRNISGIELIRLNLKLKEGYTPAVVPLGGKGKGLHIASLITNSGIVSKKLLW